MKRILAVLVLLCVLLCGCDIDINIGTSNNDTPTGTTAAATTTQAVATESTTTAQQPTQALPEKVTVYLLDSAMIYDSGRMEYTYDTDHNIQTVTVYTIEDDLMYTTFFEEQDLEGMPSSYGKDWGDSRDAFTISYFEDGKIREIQLSNGQFTGYQFEYDQRGAMIEQRLYYEGILDEAVYYEYDGEQLVAVHCEDKSGNTIYTCQVENGLILSYNYAEGRGESTRICEYDANGNMVADSYLYDGETIPGTFYTYRAVEVDYARANYLMVQQFLITLLS